MARFATFVTVAALLASPAIAVTYSAKPISPPASKRIIARDISWACGSETCRGSTDLSRPLVLCQDLAKRAGGLESFATDGRALAAADLDKCNARARATPATALASAN